MNDAPVSFSQAPLRCPFQAEAGTCHPSPGWSRRGRLHGQGREGGKFAIASLLAHPRLLLLAHSPALPGDRESKRALSTVPWTDWGKQGALGSAVQAGSLRGLAECAWDWPCRGEGRRAGRALQGVSGCWVLRDKHQTLRVLLSSSHHAFPFLAPPVGQDMPQPFPRASLPLFQT